MSPTGTKAFNKACLQTMVRPAGAVAAGNPTEHSEPARQAVE